HVADHVLHDVVLGQAGSRLPLGFLAGHRSLLAHLASKDGARTTTTFVGVGIRGRNPGLPRRLAPAGGCPYPACRPTLPTRKLRPVRFRAHDGGIPSSIGLSAMARGLP